MNNTYLVDAIETAIDENQSFRQFIETSRELWLICLEEKYTRDKRRTIAAHKKGTDK